MRLMILGKRKQGRSQRCEHEKRRGTVSAARSSLLSFLETDGGRSSRRVQFFERVDEVDLKERESSVAACDS